MTGGARRQVVERGGTRVVAPGELGRLELLDAGGGEGVIYAAPELRVEGAPGRLVFKRYRRTGISLSALERVVRVRERFAPAEREELDHLAVWPVAVVGEHGRAVGVVMPRLRDEFFCELRLHGGVETCPRELQHLLVSAQRNAKVGLAHADSAQRGKVCRQLARSFELLHAHQVVYGDVSATNVLYRLTPSVATVLVDCDGVRVRGSAAVTSQKHADDWQPPEGWGVQSVDTDCYKLGLLVLRILAPGDFASTGRDPARADPMLDAAGRKLLRAALRETGPRTPATDWRDYFDTYQAPTHTPPAPAPARPTTRPPEKTTTAGTPKKKAPSRKQASPRKSSATTRPVGSVASRTLGTPSKRAAKHTASKGAPTRTSPRTTAKAAPGPTPSRPPREPQPASARGLRQHPWIASSVALLAVVGLINWFGDRTEEPAVSVSTAEDPADASEQEASEAQPEPPDAPAPPADPDPSEPTEPEEPVRTEPHAVTAEVEVPAHFGVTAGAGAVWVAGGGRDGAVNKIDVDTQEVLATVPVEFPGPPVIGLGSVWVTSSPDFDATLLRINPDTAEVTGQVVLDTFGPSLAVGDDSVWVSSGSGNLRGVVRVDPASLDVVSKVEVGWPSAITFADGALWVANGQDVTVSRVDPATNSVTDTIELDVGPRGCCTSAVHLAQGAESLWVTVADEPGNGHVIRINPEARSQVSIVEVGRLSQGRRGNFAASPSAVWIANTFDNTVSRINPDTNTVTATVSVEGVTDDGLITGDRPSAVAITADAVWVGSNVLSRIESP